MKKLVKLLLMYVFLCLTISSCVPTYRMMKENTLEMLHASKESLDGNYLIQEINTEKCLLDLWEMLERSKSGKLSDITIQDSMHVKLELVNQNLLNVKLMQKNMIVDEFSLKGKLENDFFSVKRKYFLLPIPFLLLHFETKNLVGNTKDGNLLIMHGHKSQAWVLIMAGGGGGISQNQFEKSHN